MAKRRHRQLRSENADGVEFLVIVSPDGKSIEVGAHEPQYCLTLTPVEAFQAARLIIDGLRIAHERREQDGGA